jgi:DUF4097 and DUF4098 domain-containing protein YvlB
LKTSPQLESATPERRLRGTARVLGIAFALFSAVTAFAQPSRVVVKTNVNTVTNTSTTVNEQTVVREGRAFIEETSGNMTPARQIRVSTDNGNIRVQGGNSQQITWVIRKRSYATTEQEAKKQFERFRLNSGRRGEQAFIEAAWSGAPAHRFGVDITIQVPRDMEFIRLDTNGGNLTINGTTGRVEVATRGGNIALDDVAGAVRAQTAGGNVAIGNVNNEVVLKSGGGNVKIANAKGRVDVNTMGGDIVVGSADSVMVNTMGGSVTVNRSGGDVQISTAGGSVDLGDVSGKATVQTGGGNIRVGGAKGPVVATTGGGNVELFKLWQGAQVQSGAGCIRAEFVGGRGSFTTSSLRTAAGDVVIYLGGGLPVTIHGASEMTTGVGVWSDFPELKIATEGGEYGPKSMTVDGTLNGGGPVLKVRTTIGQIQIKKSK